MIAGVCLVDINMDMDMDINKDSLGYSILEQSK